MPKGRSRMSFATLPAPTPLTPFQLAKGLAFFSFLPSTSTYLPHKNFFKYDTDSYDFFLSSLLLSNVGRVIDPWLFQDVWMELVLRHHLTNDLPIIKYLLLEYFFFMRILKTNTRLYLGFPLSPCPQPLHFGLPPSFVFEDDATLSTPGTKLLFNLHNLKFEKSKTLFEGKTS